MTTTLQRLTSSVSLQVIVVGLLPHVNFQHRQLRSR